MHPRKVEARFYSLAETCEVVGVSRSTIKSLIASGKLRAVKIGSRTLVPAAAIDELERSLTGGSAA